MHKGNSQAAPSSAFLETVKVMQDALRSMRDIEMELHHVMGLKDIDPRLRSDMVLLREAISLVKRVLSLMGESVNKVREENAANEASDHEPLAKSERDRKCGTTSETRLEIAEALLRRRFPECPDHEIRKRAIQVTACINTETVRVLQDADQGLRNIETEVRKAMDLEGLDYRLRTEMQHVRDALGAAKVCLSVMDMRADAVLKELSGDEASDPARAAAE